jgi:hypothetical protein
VADPISRPLQSLGYTAGDGDMMVLDEHGVIETEPMIAAAADTDGILEGLSLLEAVQSPRPIESTIAAARL